MERLAGEAVKLAAARGDYRGGRIIIDFAGGKVYPGVQHGAWASSAWPPVVVVSDPGRGRWWSSSSWPPGAGGLHRVKSFQEAACCAPGGKPFTNIARDDRSPPPLAAGGGGHLRSGRGGAGRGDVSDHGRGRWSSSWPGRRLRSWPGPVVFELAAGGGPPPGRGDVSDPGRGGAGRGDVSDHGRGDVFDLAGAGGGRRLQRGGGVYFASSARRSVKGCRIFIFTGAL